MFTQKTTIILGAGASRQFGFPVGRELQDVIIGDIEKLESAIRSDRHCTQHAVPDNNAQEFVHRPLVTICAYLLRQPAGDLMPAKFEWGSLAQAMFEFRDKIQSQTHDSVDRFIRDNPRHNYIGKLLIASSIISRMYNYQPPNFKIKSFHEREYNEIRNWYHLLVNRLQEPARNALLRNTSVTIATFNYDHSLERALESQLGKSEVHISGEKSYQIPKIFHINGGLGTLPETETNVVRLVCNFAKGISLIDEDVRFPINSIREQVREAIAVSERIFVFGFAFDEANVSILGLDGYQKKDSIFCHNYDGNQGVAHAFTRLTGHPQNVMSGRKDAPIHIHEAINDGFFDR